MGCTRNTVGRRVGQVNRKRVDPPGIRAVVDEGVTGVLAPTGDAAALAAALDRVAALEPLVRRVLGAAGRRRCELRYGWPRIVDRLEQIYDSVA